MSDTVKIDYSELKDAASNAKNAARELNDYAGDLERVIHNKLLNVEGTDSYGNISSAASMVSKKIKNLRDTSAKFTSFSSAVTRFVENTKTHDDNIGKKLEEITETYVGKRSAWQKVGDFLYGTFCVDLPNCTSFTRFISDVAKTAKDKIEAVGNKIVSWFKHGGGKYVLNIVGAVLGTLAAIAGVIIAIVTIPVTGGTSLLALIPTILGVISAIASAVGAVITFMNASVQIWQNAKALWTYYVDDDEGMARYYGDISKISDYVERHDLGGKEENEKAEAAGENIDDIKVAADTTAFITGTLSGLGNVKTVDGEVTGFSLSKENVIKNIKSKIGYTPSKTDPKKLEFDFKKALDNSFTKDETIKPNKWFEDFKIFDKDSKFQKTIKVIKKSNNVVSKMKTIDSITEKAENGTEVAKKITDTLDLIGDFNVTSPIKDLGKLISNTQKTIDAIAS